MRSSCFYNPENNHIIVNSPFYFGKKMKEGYLDIGSSGFSLIMRLLKGDNRRKFWLKRKSRDISFLDSKLRNKIRKIKWHGLTQ